MTTPEQRQFRSDIAVHIDEAAHDTHAPRPGCPICERPDPHGTSWAVCERDVTRTDQHLQELLELHALASSVDYLVPAKTSDGAGPVTMHRDPPLPLDVNVLELDLGEHPLGILECWERWWREELGLATYGDASASRLERAVSHDTAREVSLAGCIGFLRSQWPLVASRTEPPPAEFATEVRNLWQWAMTTMRLTEPAPWTFPCPADLDTGQLCGYRLKVIDTTDHGIHCPQCRTTWTLERLVIVGRAAGTPAWVDADTAARALGTTPAALGPLVRTGALKRRGEGHHRRYDIHSIRHADNTTNG